ncbi:adenosylcobalamin-dependent ribonucleoside-diphosphate reductase [Hoeflea sp. TYP-13]|uniref:adenosylcobalamin-dependent ribonucleoside-diphosphate reductase n=1 Tax=Hoeflea sp. TYP-13 TaxID=3230023 RepID=UPI0034C66B71
MMSKTTGIYASDIRFDRIDGCYDATFSANAMRLLKERFLLIRNDGDDETPADMMQRIASTLAQTETENGEVWQDLFFRTMSKLLFLPGSRVMANAGTTNPQLGNCFVLPLADDRREILKTFSDACDIKGNGGGCGFNYSNIRPRGDIVREHDELACGPTAFLKLFDSGSAIFRQKGRYESGNLAIINIDHPDAIEFASAKLTDGDLRLTNISVGINDAFMEAVKAGKSWQLKDPRTGEVLKEVDAAGHFNAICELAWQTGDPGVVFLDHLNRDNPLLDSIGPINAMNTCGEVGLFPYESSNLGYLNLVRLLKSNPSGRRGMDLFDDALLRAVVHVGIRMIDNSISASWYPVDRIFESVRSNRRIGLGVTGWADCLALAGIAYDSDEAIDLAEAFAGTLRSHAEEATKTLAIEKGAYPNSKLSGEVEKRNISLLALPPSGNHAIIFDSSFSIEPYFSLYYLERVMGDQEFFRKNKYLEEALLEIGMDPDPVFAEIAKNAGSVQDVERVPQQIRTRFKIAHEIAPEIHVRVQAAFQKYVDNGVTKTVNLPFDSKPGDVARCYMLAWELGCKGVTVYRDRSRSKQAIEFDGRRLEESNGVLPN